MIAPADEGRHHGGSGFADAVTFAWADAGAELYGFARLGIANGQGSVLAVLFSGREPVAAVARGGLELGADAGWDALALGGVEARIDMPLEAWTLAADVEESRVDLRFEATGGPAAIDDGHPLARAGGMAGYEQPCRVCGSVTVAGRRAEVRCTGQRGHQWGAPDWERIALARTVTLWLDDGAGVALSAVRPAKASDHAGEAVWAALLGPEGAEPVADPRLSTTYDEDGRQRRAGLELWVHDDDPYPQRATGEVLCGSTLDLGQLRLDCAFFGWRVDGRDAIGRYDLLRRT